MQDLRAGSGDLGAQLDHAFAVGTGARLVERVVDAVVHAVAGDDQLRFHRGEHAIEPLVQIGARELAVGMAFFRKARNGLARQAEVEHLPGRVRMISEERRLDNLHVGAAVGDAVAKEQQAFLRRRRSGQGDGQTEDQEEGADHANFQYGAVAGESSGICARSFCATIAPAAALDGE